MADVIGGGTPRTGEPENFVDGEVPWVTPADLSGYTQKLIGRGARNITQRGLASSGAQLMPKGTVLFSSRAPIGYVAIAANPISTNQGFKSFVVPHGVSPDYIYYYLKAAKDVAVSLASGTTFLEISGAKAKQIPLPLAPEGEQTRIVAEIEKQFTRLDAAVTALKRVQANLKRYRAAVLKASCEGRLVPTEAEVARKEGRNYETGEQLLACILRERRTKWEVDQLAKMVAAGKPPKNDDWKKRYREPEPVDTGELPTLPEGWTWATAGYLFECIVPNRDKPRSFTGTTPWITLPDFDDSIELTASKSGLGLTEEEVAKYRARVIPKGSVIMSCVGRFGITAVAGVSVVINQQLHAFVIPAFLAARYYAYALRTQVRYMENLSTATTISYLNKENCNSVPIPLAPLVEQERIVQDLDARLSVAAQMQQQIRVTLARADRLRQSILKRAFEGKLVPQDPNDESASVLLERIRAQRTPKPQPAKRTVKGIKTRVAALKVSEHISSPTDTK